MKTFKNRLTNGNRVIFLGKTIPTFVPHLVYRLLNRVMIEILTIHCHS